MKTLPSANQTLINQSEPRSEKEPANIQRRTLIGGGLVALLSGIPCNANEDTAIGKFYVQFAGSLAAYQLPGGAIAMQFTPKCGGFKPGVPDGLGGFYLNGTFELTILAAAGIYRSFEGGHNHMVDRLHLLTPGDGSGGADEYCFCFITRCSLICFLEGRGLSWEFPRIKGTRRVKKSNERPGVNTHTGARSLYALVPFSTP